MSPEEGGVEELQFEVLVAGRQDGVRNCITWRRYPPPTTTKKKESSPVTTSNPTSNQVPLSQLLKHSD